MSKALVMDYWENKLRQVVSLPLPLPSLVYFKPAFYSLAKPHPILWTAGANPHEVTKAVIQLRMLSGRYRTAMLTRHWSFNNKSGFCQAPSCTEVQETLDHLLISCPYYTQTRGKLVRLWTSCKNTSILHLVSSVLGGPPQSLIQFILDASVHPAVISMSQIYGPEPLQIIFHLSRSWCYSVHIQRVKLQRRLNFNWIAITVFITIPVSPSIAVGKYGSLAQIPIACLDGLLSTLC